MDARKRHDPVEPAGGEAPAGDREPAADGEREAPPERARRIAASREALADDVESGGP